MNSMVRNEDKDFSGDHSDKLLDPDLLKSARAIYHTYCHFHLKLKKPPIGVAIDRKTHKGQLIFTNNPILLPDETLILIDQIES